MPKKTEPVKDRQTVTPEGKPVDRKIDGLIIRPAVTLEDKRGEIIEGYRPSWGLHPDPMVYM
ncbi:MAG TPA: hypothetical protein VL860_06515, partial [Planctomycetota bacterium]|nr:hypothetical protein [Planctomycetota bacterium]